MNRIKATLSMHSQDRKTSTLISTTIKLLLQSGKQRKIFHFAPKGITQD